MMNQTIRTARHRQAGAAQDVWQPCTGVGTGSFNCLSSLSLYPVAGNRLQGQVERIEGSAIKDRRQLKIWFSGSVDVPAPENQELSFSSRLKRSGLPSFPFGMFRSPLFCCLTTEVLCKWKVFSKKQEGSGCLLTGLMTLQGLWRDPRVSYLSEKCAPEVYLNTKRRHACPSALLFFTIPKFRTGGRSPVECASL